MGCWSESTDRVAKDNSAAADKHPNITASFPGGGRKAPRFAGMLRVLQRLALVGLSVVTGALATKLFLRILNLVRDSPGDLWRIQPLWLLLLLGAWFLLGTVLLTSTLLTISAGRTLCGVFFADPAFGQALRGNDPAISAQSCGRKNWRSELAAVWIYAQLAVVVMVSSAVVGFIPRVWWALPAPAVLAGALLLTSVLLWAIGRTRKEMLKSDSCPRQSVVVLVLPTAILVSPPALAAGAGLLMALLIAQLFLVAILRTLALLPDRTVGGFGNRPLKGGTWAHVFARGAGWFGTWASGGSSAANWTGISTRSRRRDDATHRQKR
jgi:hypothetical protein